ncbi:hypothetical protein [Neotabrizicola sp. VNH66]|uniref:hypothetical protein n=1 Tax=Neotabrizicola sp. VNH66 TaxID=3400918 RepID=UPI003C014FF0
MSDATMQIERLNLGQDWRADILRQDEDSWLILFTDLAGMPRAVDCGALQVEAISSDQIARNLKLRPGATPGTVVGEGWVEFATHARISLTTPEGRLSRQHRFPDAPVVTADRGPRGGFMTDMGHGAQVEIIGQGGPVWGLVFYNGGAEGPAAPAELITLESIDAEGRIEVFAAEPTAVVTTLSVSTGDAQPVRLRLAWSHGDHAHRREFDLPQG